MKNASSISRSAVSIKLRVAAFARGGRSVGQLRSKGERGSTLIEFALVVPMFLILVMGMYSFGLLFTEYISLTEAINIGGQQFAVARNEWADPCATIAGDIVSASPFLKASKMAYTFTVNGTATSFTEGTTPTCTAMFTTLKGFNPSAGLQIPVTVSATYYCTGVTAFKFGTLANFNPLPTASCTLTAQITEVLQ